MPEVTPEALDDWIEITSGAAFSSKYFSIEDGLPLVRIRDLGKGSTVTRYTGPYDAAFLLENGDVLIGMDGDFAVERWEGGTALLNQRVCKVASRSDELDQGFLYHFLKPKIADIHRITPETTVRHLSTKDLRKIPRPEMDRVSQKLIADILDAIDEAVLETEAIVEKLLSIRVGLTEDLLTFGIGSDGRPRSSVDVAETSLGRVPSSWSRGNLGSIAEAITSGSRGWASYYSDSGAKFLRIGNLTRQHINLRLDDLVYVTPPTGQEGSRTAVRENDLLISITADLGIIGSIPADFGEAYVNQHISLVRLRESAVNPRWPAHFLSSRRAQIMFQKLNDQGAKAGINLPAVGQIQVPLPPREEQDAIVERLDAADEEVARYRVEHAKLSSLREGLRDDLLTGRKPVVAIREAAE
jgi:type I restriction enzyme S subunit